MNRKKPRRRLYGWLLVAGAIACMLVAVLCAVALATARGKVLDSVLCLTVILASAGFIAFGVAYLEEDARRFEAAWERLFGVDDRGPGARWERWPRPPRKPRPKVFDEPRDSAFWMRRLAKYYARLARLQEMQAPETIIENERRMIRETIALLSPADALAVMRSWKELASEHVKKARKVPPVDEPN